MTSAKDPAGAGLFRESRNANLWCSVAPVRIRSSFIYLANAVNDLSGNWVSLGLVLAPLVLLASLCLLPDALNLQHRVAHTFESGLHSVGSDVHEVSLREVQTPYRPQASPAPEIRDLYPWWMTTSLHLVFALITLTVNLVVLCALARMQAGLRAPRALGEAIEVYRHSIFLLPAFFWIALLQLLATAVGFILLVVPALFAFIWLYFAQYALVFDNLHSWPALLHSRDLMRGRFFKIAVRILVFLAVWSGYNSWASGAFIGASILLGPMAAVTGYVWGTVFVLDLMSVGVAYMTTAFFLGAGVRLYQDLTALAKEPISIAPQSALQDTAALPTAASGR